MRLVDIVKRFVKAVNFFVPKKRKKVMIASFPDFADNARALYEYFTTHEKYNDFTFIWVVSANFKPIYRKNTIFIHNPVGVRNKDYVIYLYHLMTSKYLFCTHSSFDEAVPSRQVSVLLWHGTMLKRICAMNDREKMKGGKPQYRFFVSPSKFYVGIFSKSFVCKEKNVLVCGYPRNDYLFEKTDVLTKLGINKDDFSKIIVYMPTFRTPLDGSYTDSTVQKQMCIDIEDTSTLARLSCFLEERKMLLIIKWHPSDIRQSMLFQSKGIMAIQNQVLEIIDAQVYHLLHYADALITDYSSVFCDYLLLDRPIAFDVSDIDSYSDKRGFVFDTPLDYMPGMKLYNEADFLSFCDDLSNNIDRSRDARCRMMSVYNDFSDNNNSQRLLASLGL